MKRHALHVPGMATLSVLAMTTVVMVLVMLVWRTSMLSYDLGHERQRYEQYRSATQGLLTVGLTMCVQHYTHIMEQAAPVTVTFAAWPVGEGTTCQGRVDIEPAKQGMQISAHLVRETK